MRPSFNLYFWIFLNFSLWIKCIEQADQITFQKKTSVQIHSNSDDIKGNKAQIKNVNCREALVNYKNHSKIKSELQNDVFGIENSKKIQYRHQKLSHQINGWKPRALYSYTPKIKDLKDNSLNVGLTKTTQKNTHISSKSFLYRPSLDLVTKNSKDTINKIKFSPENKDYDERLEYNSFKSHQQNNIYEKNSLKRIKNSLSILDQYINTPKYKTTSRKRRNIENKNIVKKQEKILKPIDSVKNRTQILYLPSILDSSISGQQKSILDLRNLNVSNIKDPYQISVPQISSSEQIIIIGNGEEYEKHLDRNERETDDDDYVQDEPHRLPIKTDIKDTEEDDDFIEDIPVVYAEQHSEIKLMCEISDATTSSVWYKNDQVVHTLERTSRPTDFRFLKDPSGSLTITNVMLEDNGEWHCEIDGPKRHIESARSVKLVVLDRPKVPYLLIDSRRLDAGNSFVPVKENSELSLACISEGGNPKPILTWEVLLSPGVDRHAQKIAAEVLELEEIKNEKDNESYKINSGAKSEVRLPAVYRAHHNARILCVMEHPTLKMRLNASILLDVQYTPSFAISRTPGFGYPLREGMEVSLKCDADSNPPSSPLWQKDDGETPVPQSGDGYLNFTSIRREHSGWYKCTSRHLNFQYSSIGYYLSIRFDSVDVTSEPDEQEVVAASHNPSKGQLEVQLGGAVTLQCPQGSLGCWSHLDPVTARLRGLGVGISTPTGQFSLKDVVYQDAGTYKCIGQSQNNKKKLEVLQSVAVHVKGAPTAIAKNSAPVAYPGSPLHLSTEFCANPPAYAARWLHGDRVYTPGNQYGSTVLAYSVTDLPTPFCKEAKLTYVSMHERVPRTFYFIVSSPGGVAEAIFKVNFTLRYKTISNSINDEEEELSEPEEIHFPVFGSSVDHLNASKILSLISIVLIFRVYNLIYIL